MATVVLTDIEGTTSSLSFVKDVLFPYASEHLGSYVAAHDHEAPVQRELRAAARLASIDEDDRDAIVARLLHWIATDEKATPLKSLQGMIWEAGYAEGHYRAHLYEDAHECLQAWYAQSVPLYVYSSGSVKAQQLFFQYSAYGDLRHLFRGHFDTTTGPKRAPDAYHRIAQAIGSPVGDILFLSDVDEELDAAASVGMRTTRLLRPQDYPSATPDATSAHPVVASFRDVALAP
ncbi:MAG: acireductone synthase [Pseudomonadota bacterium]